MTDLLPLTPNPGRDTPMQFDKATIQRNVLSIKEMIDNETDPDKKTALKLRLVEWNSKLMSQ